MVIILWNVSFYSSLVCIKKVIVFISYSLVCIKKVIVFISYFYFELRLLSEIPEFFLAAKEERDWLFRNFVCFFYICLELEKIKATVNVKLKDMLNILNMGKGEY